MKEFDQLIEIVRQLRGEKGCDWDKKQTFDSMKKYILEEVYELFEAIEKKDFQEMQEELGDLAMHIVFLSVMAEEKAYFTIEDVLKKINEKLIARHPHVFSSLAVSGVEEILKNWEALKKQEKKAERKYYLDGIPSSMPAMNQAIKIQEKMARIGFDWGNKEGVLEKLEEELKEMHHEIQSGNKEKLEEEIGDVFFVLLRFAMKVEIDPETALKKVNQKVIHRFRFMEDYLKQQNKKLEDCSLEQLEEIWQLSKKHL